MTWQQRTRETVNLERQEGSSFTQQPFGANVTSTDGYRERVDINSPIGPSHLRVTHPFLGANSWIRGIPDPGSVVNLVFEGDTRRLVIQNYLTLNTQTKLESYEALRFHYRDMLPGEIDISSSGYAQAFFSRRGNLSLRGGITHGHLSQDELEVMFRAPTHVRQLHRHSPDELGDEERFGVVKRPNPLNVSKQTWLKTIDQSRFAKEYHRSLKTGTGVPTYLVDHVEGDVLDPLGVPKMLSSTGQPLRAESNYYTLTNTALSISIDQLGNFLVQLPDEAVNGGRMDIPLGKFELTTGQHVEITTDMNIVGTAGIKIKLDGRNGIDLTFSGGQMVPGGLSGSDGVITCKSLCPFTGAPHSDGSVKISAEKV